MKRRVLSVLLLMMTTTFSEGRVLELGPVPSRFLGGARTVQVYVPPSYDTESRQRYPVLYLHDGQNMFSSAGADCCFGWGSWDLDRTVDRLVEEGRIREIILVAVANSRSRYREYRGRIYAPGKSRSTNAPAPDNKGFDAYANFLVKELKPRIDREFRTLKTAGNTGVLGSSLGGICSLSLAWELPRTFGLAASLSGSFQIEKSNFLLQVLRPYEGKRKPIRIYLDSGVIDYTGDDDGRKLTEALATELRRLGWKDGRDLAHYVDPAPLGDRELEEAGLRHGKWAEARTSQHNEFYWRQRVWRALTYLFPPDRAGRTSP